MSVAATRPTVTPGFTLAEYLALPEDGHQIELIEGRYVVMNPPLVGHPRVIMRLIGLLAPLVPDGYELLAAPVGLKLSEATVVEPDLVFGREGGGNKDRFLDLPVPLVVEVVSPGQPSHDRVMKRHLYAEAGIEHYWIVDVPADRVTILRLAPGGGGYDVVVEGRRVTVDAPVALTVDLAALLAARPASPG